MEQKGIDIEVAPLKELVDSLRQQEPDGLPAA